MRKMLTLTALLLILGTLSFAQVKSDSIHIKTVKGIENGFIVKSFVRVMDSNTTRIIVVSPNPTPAGFIPVKIIGENIDTIGHDAIDTITAGLPQAPAPLYVGEWLINGIDTTFSNNGQVTTLAKPTKPTINFIGIPYNSKGKVFVNLSLSTNVNAKLYAFTVFDSNGIKIPRKSWNIPAGTKSFFDSSYFAGSTNVFMGYAIVNEADSIPTPFVFIPGYQGPQKPDVGIDTISELNSTTILIKGWVQTYNLDTKIKVNFTSGDTTNTITVQAGNGISRWSITKSNLIPDQTYTFKATATNAKGSNVSNIETHKMGSTPTPWNVITKEKVVVSYDKIVISCNYSLPKSGFITFDYCDDSNFTFPIEWKTWNSITGSGFGADSFYATKTGKFYGRITVGDYDTINVVKIIPFSVTKLTVGIEDNIDVQISVYPNPTTNFIIAHSTGQYTITNMSGQVVKKDFLRDKSEQIFVSELIPGNYILTILENGKIKTSKFQKK